MPVMLERWNDDKMDALDAKVGRLETDVATVNVKLDGQREELYEQRKEMKAGFARIDEKFERLHRTLFLASVAVITALVAALTGALVGHP
jgi:hypothetical protein